MRFYKQISELTCVGMTKGCDRHVDVEASDVWLIVMNDEHVATRVGSPGCHC